MENESAGRGLTNADAARFEQVFKTHFKNLHSYVYTIVKDEATAEEIVQNVFYKLWEKKERISIEVSVAAYLYKSVYSESLNYLKHIKVRAEHKAYTARQDAAGHEDMDPATIKELRSKIDEAVSELPEQCRAIFQMSRFEGLKYRDIADRLGISVKTVENQMGKALKTMRTKLLDYLPVIVFVLINIKNPMR